MKKKLNKFEFNKYENIANQKLKLFEQNKKNICNPIPLYLKKPYVEYKKILLEKKTFGGTILEIGSGTGDFTNIPLQTKMNVIASDISPLSLKFVAKRYEKYNNLDTMIVNMEDLPFKDSSLNIVCGVGFLSYGNNAKTKNEITKQQYMRGDPRTNWQNLNY